MLLVPDDIGQMLNCILNSSCLSFVCVINFLSGQENLTIPSNKVIELSGWDINVLREGLSKI